MIKLLLLLLIPATSFAGIVGSAGLAALEGFGSESKTSDNISYLQVNPVIGAAIELDFPILSSYFTFNTTLLISNAQAKAQYFDRKANLQVKDLKARYDSLDFLVGGRFKFINFKRFKMFTGAGVMVGSSKVNFSESDFIRINGSKNSSYKDDEQQNKWGKYFEIGSDIVATNKSAFSIIWRVISSDSQGYETLNNKGVESRYNIIALQYRHYFDFKGMRSSSKK